MKIRSILLIGTAIAVMGCKKSPSDLEKEIKIVNDNFNNAADSWLVDFVDYPMGKETEWEIGSGISNLPDPLDTSIKGLRISGINRSDDLFMFLKKKIVGLNPNQDYTVSLDVEFASNAPSNMAGVGGAPGESVRIKAGLTPVEPVKVLEDDGYYRLNLDKDSQSSSGKDLHYIDHIGNGTQEEKYSLLTKKGKFRAEQMKRARRG